LQKSKISRSFQSLTRDTLAKLLKGLGDSFDCGRTVGVNAHGARQVSSAHTHDGRIVRIEACMMQRQRKSGIFARCLEEACMTTYPGPKAFFGRDGQDRQRLVEEAKGEKAFRSSDVDPSDKRRVEKLTSFFLRRRSPLFGVMHDPYSRRPEYGERDCRCAIPGRDPRFICDVK
jgi:hypothetical protein